MLSMAALALALSASPQAGATPREMAGCPTTQAAASALLAGLPHDSRKRPGKQQGWDWYPADALRIVGFTSTQVAVWPNGEGVDQLLVDLPAASAGRLEAALRKQFPGKATVCEGSVCEAKSAEWAPGKLYSVTLLNPGNGSVSLTCAYSSGW